MKAELTVRKKQQKHYKRNVDLIKIKFAAVCFCYELFISVDVYIKIL